jgi:hypothetical protein
MKMNSASWLLAATIGLTTISIQAQEKPAVEFSGSGFLTLAAGKILGGTRDNADTNPNYLGYKGPHFISDWAQGAVYENKGVQLAPDSRLGLQGSAIFSPNFSLTGQVVARGARDGKVDLEWLYGSYKVNNNLTLQIGRKRLPILYYSESQDVGVSYPWVHLPTDLYGWQVVNYNGANLMYRDQIENWSYTATAFAGAETNKDSGYQKMYNGKHSKTNVRWTNILGGELALSRDWFETRIGYFQNDAENGITGTSDYQAKYRQKIYTLGFVIDYGNWLIRNEYYVGDLSRVEEKDYAQIYAIGYRMGQWTPMLTYSNYQTRYKVGGPIYGYSHDGEERHDTRSVSLRYDLGSSSALKLQYDDYRDYSGPTFHAGGTVATGNARLITLSYDKVF